MEARDSKCLFLSTEKAAVVLELTLGCQSPGAFTMERSVPPCCCSSRSIRPTEPHSARDLERIPLKVNPGPTAFGRVSYTARV